jgi:hypothetical protein
MHSTVAKAFLIFLAGLLALPFVSWAETAVIIDKQNEYNGCTVEVIYDEKDMIREGIEWSRSLHYFDYDWELRKAIDFYPDRGEKTGIHRAKRVILFDPAGKEQSVIYYDRRGNVIEQVDF